MSIKDLDKIPMTLDFFKRGDPRKNESPLEPV